MQGFERLLIIFGLLTIVLVGGTVGYRLIEGAAWFDSFYMSLTTLTTVGYEEVIPLSRTGRIFNSFLIISGVTSVFVSVGILADWVIKLELADYFGRRRRIRMFRGLSGHYIVCGGGRVGRGVAEELLRSRNSIVVIDRDPAQLQWARDRNIPSIVADATEDESLEEARIEAAKGLVAAVTSDAENVYVTLTARALRRDLPISARASDEQAATKLKTAGATTVVTPYPFIGHRLAQSMLRPYVVSFLDVALAFGHSSGHELEIGQVTIGDSAEVIGMTLEEAKIPTRYKVIVLAVQKDGQDDMEFNPSADTPIDVGDTLIVIGDNPDLKRMEADFETSHANR